MQKSNLGLSRSRKETIMLLLFPYRILAVILLIFVSIFLKQQKLSRRIKFDNLVEVSHSTSSRNVFSVTGRSQCDLFSNNECDWCGKKRLKIRR